MIAALALLLAHPPLAGEPVPDHAYNTACDGTTPGQQRCYVEALARSEARLERYIELALRGEQRVHDTLDEEEMAAAQRAFLAYRERQCAAVRDMLEGHGAAKTAPVLCEIALTDARAHFIREQFLTWPSGESSYPEPERTQVDDLRSPRLPEAE